MPASSTSRPLTSHLKAAVYGATFVSGLSAVLAGIQPVMRILMIHGVGGDDCPPDAFEAQMEWLGRHFRVVPLETVIRKVAAREAAAREVALTFDDGLRNNFTLAYPVLRRLGLPATFFVCPGLLDSQSWLWNHEARERLRGLGGPERAETARSLGAPSEDLEEIVEWMKSLAPRPRKEAEAAIRAATPGFTPSEEQHEQFDMMSWDEVKAIDRTLVTIGSHSFSHPILPTLDPQAQEYEVRESRRRLEEVLGGTVDTFCFPNGSRDQHVQSLVKSCYQGAVTTVRGFVRPWDSPHGLRRISVASQARQLAWRMHRPSAAPEGEGQLDGVGARA